MAKLKDRATQGFINAVAIMIVYWVASPRFFMYRMKKDKAIII